MTAATRTSTGATGTGRATPAGRLAWAALDGPELDRTGVELLDRGVGGVVLFSRNIASATAVRGLVAEMRERATQPLRVAIDHEGGHVARIGAPLTRWPSAMALAATGSPPLAGAVATAVARELAWLGIDVALGPVLDVASDPANPSVSVRAYSSDPSEVARFGRAATIGQRAGGVASVAKHFPGHGRTPTDSHHELPVVDGGLDRLRGHDLVPFRAAIEAGVEAVMVAHVAYEGVTDGEPATVAPAIVTELLRRELGYDGFVMTDALNMRAVAGRMPIPDACVAALLAGADAVLPLDRQAESLDALERAAESGRLSTDRVASSIGRAERLDRTIAALGAGRDGEGWDRPAHHALTAEVAARSLTLVRGAVLLPIPHDARLAVIEFASRRPSPVEESAEPEASLAARLFTRYPSAREFQVGAQTAEPMRSAIVDAASGADLVIVATRDAYLWDDDQELIERVMETGRPLLIVALRNPFDLVSFPAAAGAIAAYADVPATLDALIEALAAGPSAFRGRLPMDLPALEGGGR